MKRGLWVLLITLALKAEYIPWRSNYDKAHQEARKEHKSLMVLLIKEDCHLCYKMLRTTFKDQPYLKKINEKFVSVLVTKGQQGSYPIEMLYTMTYPSVFFLNSKELFIGENIYGYADSDAFEKHLKSLINEGPH